jgi:integrase/recombinase XerD
MSSHKKKLTGHYNDEIKSFIAQKRLMGYKCDAIEECLFRFSKHTLNYSFVDKSLSKEIVLDWIAKRKNESVGTWEHRKGHIKQFALYLQFQGYEVFIPHKKHRVYRPKYIPYIFTSKEIRVLPASVQRSIVN